MARKTKPTSEPEAHQKAAASKEAAANSGAGGSPGVTSKAGRAAGKTGSAGQARPAGNLPARRPVKSTVASRKSTTARGPGAGNRGAARKPAYHHGDLRNALLQAAERELQAHGVEGLSLRGVARAAGVSHAAPTHHFGDIAGLLTALAVIGFQRFLDAQRQQETGAGDNPLDRLAAATVGYVEFASKNPELFQLMFTSDKPDRAEPSFQQAGNAAFDHLVELVAATHGRELAPAANVDLTQDADLRLNVQATWALVHGLSTLLNAGFLQLGTASKKQRAEMVAEIMRRYWASQGGAAR